MCTVYRRTPPGRYFLGECFLNEAVFYVLRSRGCLEAMKPLHCSDNADCVKRIRKAAMYRKHVVALVDLEEAAAQRRGLIEALRRLGCSGLPEDTDPPPRPLLVECPSALVVLLPGGPERLLENMGETIDVGTRRRLKSRELLRETAEGASSRPVKLVKKLAEAVAEVLCRPH